MWYTWGRSKMHTEFAWGKLKDRPLGTPRHRWEDNCKKDLKN
jgi:hypothetical protein